MKKRKRGRPRKRKGSIAFWQFRRAAMAMCAYDEAREMGQKHSVAVAQAVDVVRRRHPEMCISETELRRVLAAWRPRSRGTILRFERSAQNEEQLTKIRWIQEQVAMLKQEQGVQLPVPSDVNPPKPVTTFKIRFAERPNYPRFNRKTPGE